MGSKTEDRREFTVQQRRCETAQNLQPGGPEPPGRLGPIMATSPRATARASSPCVLIPMTGITRVGCVQRWVVNESLCMSSLRHMHLYSCMCPSAQRICLMIINPTAQRTQVMAPMRKQCPFSVHRDHLYHCVHIMV